MKNDESIQAVFFNIVSNSIIKDNWRDEIFQNLLSALFDYLNVDHSAFYVFYERTASLILVTEIGDTNKVQLNKQSIGLSEVSITDILIKSEERNVEDLLQFRLSEDEILYLYVASKSAINSEMKSLLDENLEKVISILTVMNVNQNQSRNNKFLLDLSTKLIKSNDKDIILEEVANALKNRYGQYEYSLHLTQEHETNLDLPIKIMQYTDENIDEVRTKVFMTGELEIESRINEQLKYIYAPLIGEQSVYGVLELIIPIDKYFSKYELDFITEFAILAGKALEKTILYEDSLIQVTNLTLLNEIIHELNASSELTEITSHISSKIRSLTDASEVGFIYYDEESNKVANVLAGSTFLFMEDDGKELIQYLKEKVDVNLEPIFSGSFDKDGLDYHSIMVIPMLYSGLSMGFAVILHEERYHFTFDAFKLIQSLMQHSSVVISNTMLKERLQTTVITDFLTQLYSRRYLEEKVEEHMSEGKSGSLLILDIDDFKKVNDKYGHHVGDKVLKQVAQVMETSVGDHGIPTRWGGEELAVYFPDLNLDDAFDKAEDIRIAISENTNPRITVSCGISYWYSGDDTTYETLFLKADEALYRAKADNKNCVVTS
ncbi:sensor domain-containing diguanylate cyclase [Oceanobacillus sp. CAU 1775]